MQIEYINPDELKAAAYNPRRIGPRALRALAGLMDQHGFVDPVIARREDRLLIAGHQRLRANALRSAPDPLVPCIFLDGVSDERAKALNVALNNPSAQGRYDGDLLAGLLEEIDLAGLDASAMTGFTPEEIADLTAGLDDLDDLAPPDLTLPDPAPAPAAAGPEANAPRTVVLVFEMPHETFERVKADFDRLIADHHLLCHVRMTED